MTKVSGIRAMLKNRAMRETLYSSAEYWDSKALEYNDKAVSMWPNNHLNSYYHREQTALLERYLPNVVGARILDVGCGTGRMSEYFAQRGASVLGIDFSAKSIEIARKRLGGDNPNYRVQSVFDLDEVAAFDLVVSWSVLTVACKDRLELSDVMKKLYRSLKQDGKALLLEPIHHGFLHRVLGLDHGVGHPASCSLSHCSSRWTEGCRRNIDCPQYCGKHRAGLLPEKPLRSRGPVRPREEEVVHRGQTFPLSGAVQSS
jgi:SAM-dependent methyltransferase